MKKRITIEEFVNIMMNEAYDEYIKKTKVACEAGEEVKPKIGWLDWVKCPDGDEGVVVRVDDHGKMYVFYNHLGRGDIWQDSELTLIRKHERNQP